MNKYLRQTDYEDVRYLAPRLRQADKDECMAATGYDPKVALCIGLKFGDITQTMLAPDGEPLGMFGVGKSNVPDAGAIWMVATDNLVKHQMKFLRLNKPVIETLQTEYLALFNFVDARNTLHIKWLKWMGFTFIKRHEHWGFEKRPFYEFVRI